MNWADFIQQAAGQYVDTRLEVYKLEKTPVAYDAATDSRYVEGQAITSKSIAGVSPTVLIVGGAAVLLLAFVLLKD